MLFKFRQIFFLRITAFQHERAFFVFRYTDFVRKQLPWLQQEYHSCIPDVSNYSSIKFCVRIWSTNGNILDCLQTFSVFLSFFFFWKTVQILIFEDEYLDNGLADFNHFGLILQDFARPFK